MYMSIEQKRAEVAKLRPWDGWKRMVAQMPDKQINAIYYNRVLGATNRSTGGALR